MKTRDLLLGFVSGIAAGYVIRQVAKKVVSNVPADFVLAQIKSAFKKEGPIDGSWIYMKPEEFQNGAITMNVYRGGITRMRDGELENYEFKADSQTGSIVELLKV